MKFNKLSLLAVLAIGVSIIVAGCGKSPSTDTTGEGDASSSSSASSAKKLSGAAGEIGAVLSLSNYEKTLEIYSKKLDGLKGSGDTQKITALMQEFAAESAKFGQNWGAQAGEIAQLSQEDATAINQQNANITQKAQALSKKLQQALSN
ncbi:MAG: hypothetical protein GKR87_16545 [Kiritimatiellae bacterium]|nr:hypothetical protein [Kiritimatiellia bacterium]